MKGKTKNEKNMIKVLLASLNKVCEDLSFDEKGKKVDKTSLSAISELKEDTMPMIFGYSELKGINETLTEMVNKMKPYATKIISAKVNNLIDSFSSEVITVSNKETKIEKVATKEIEEVEENEEQEKNFEDKNKSHNANDKIIKQLFGSKKSKKSKRKNQEISEM